MGAVALVALALGLAFGLGGRDHARRLVNKWYEEGRAQAPKIAEADSMGGGGAGRGYSDEENGR
jgi:hypothetical protein